MPTARKFHYQFNLRDFTKIIQNIMQIEHSPYAKNPLGLASLSPTVSRNSVISSLT